MGIFDRIDWSRPLESAPLRASKVGDGPYAAPAVDASPFLATKGTVGARRRRTESYATTEHVDGKLPEGSPDGWPWIYWPGSDALDGTGLDSNGTFWYIRHASGGISASIPAQWMTTTLSESGGSFNEAVIDFAQNVVLPTVVAVVGTMVAGPSGVLLVAAMQASLKIARGGRVSDAVVSSTRDNLGALIATGVFDTTIEKAKSLGLESMYEYGRALKIETERDAYAKAATLASAYVAQEKSLAELTERFPDASSVIAMASKLGASPLDIANGVGGTEEKLAMDAALIRNGRYEGAASETDGSSSAGTVAAAAAGTVGLGLLLWWLL